jgi:hypothetical protein
MPKYVIERNMPGAGSLPQDRLCEAAKLSNEAIASLGPRAQWQHSYVTAGKLYCVYIADNEDAIREHARLAGVPADAISQVCQIIDPTTGEG